MTTTENKLYLVALDTLERLPIQFVPTALNMQRQGSYPSLEVVGRTTPVYQFTGGRKSISLDLDFYSIVEGREDVITKVQWLESLTHSNGPLAPPQRVLLVWGELFQGETWIASSVQTSLEQFSKLDEYLPIQAYVRLNLLLDSGTNLTWQDTRR